MNASIEDNLRCLRQALALMRGLSDEEFSRTDSYHMGCSLGAQLRHIHDHYTCLLRGLESGVVDYENRPRCKDIETERTVAIRAFEDVMAALQRIPTSRAVAPLAVQIHTGALAGADNGAHGSSVLRELQFVLLHAVHHYALIALELRARGLSCDADFGVAPATLAWRERQRQTQA